MALVNVVQGDMHVAGALTCGTPPQIARSQLLQSNNDRYKIKPTDWRIFDAFQTPLGATPTSDDDLALVGGTFGSASPAIQAGDVKAVSKTRRARCTFELPAEYVAGESVTIRAHAGMVTTVADGSCTVDFEVYRSDDEAGVGSDICATAAQSMNSLTDANKDFTITPTTLLPGDTLDIRMTIASVDSATVTAVIPSIGSVELLLDVKG